MDLPQKYGLIRECSTFRTKRLGIKQNSCGEIALKMDGEEVI